MRYEEIEPSIGCIYLSGILDLRGVEQIEARFAATTAQKRPMIVDLSEVELMMSVGLGLLITNANALKTHGKRMVLLNPKPHVEKVVRMADLEDLLPIEYDMAAALRRIKTGL